MDNDSIYFRDIECNLIEETVRRNRTTFAVAVVLTAFVAYTKRMVNYKLLA